MAISQKEIAKLAAEVEAECAALDRHAKEMHITFENTENIAKKKKASNEDKKNPLSLYRLEELEKRIKNLPLGIMLVGPTGVGKSSTINALLGRDDAVVGYGVNPETMETKSYRFNQYIKIWDTPGLGDSPEKDKEHAKKIKRLLHKKYISNKQTLGRTIDLVVVILDGSRRDIGTVFSFVKNIIMPEIDGKNILFIVNQADMSMKGRHFDESTGKPDETLQKYLVEQSESMKTRIKESTGISITDPVFYSATNRFNLTSIFDFIIENKDWEMRKYSAFYEYLGSKYYKEDIERLSKRTVSNSTNISESSDLIDDIGDVVTNVLTAPLNAVSDFFEWLSLL